MLLAKMNSSVPWPAASTSASMQRDHHRSCSNSSSNAKFFVRRLLGMLSRKHAKQQQRQSSSNASTPAIAGRQCGLDKVFDYFDENGDGKISPLELQRCMRAVGEELSPEEAEAVVGSSDSDGDGLLGLEDFVKLVEGDGREGEEEKGRHLRDAFRMYAAGEEEEEEAEGRGGSGRRITPKSLRRMLRRLGESRTNDECAAMIRRFDINGDGVLSFDEFKIMMLI